MSFPQFRRLLDTYGSFIITCHETPDGDAIGSEIALYHALRQLNKDVRIINADETPAKYQFLYSANTVGEISPDSVFPTENTALIILDTNDTHNIGLVGRDLLPHMDEFFIIDHHENGKDISTGRLIEVESSSTCEILYKIFTELEIDISLEMARALYVGIIYDTGCFIYPKTTAFTFSVARHLVSIGAEPNELYSAIYESNSVSSLRLQSKVLSTLELHFDQQVAVQTMPKEMINEVGAVYEEADSLINTPLKSGQIRVSVFFKENSEGLLRCSLRSKGKINVAEIAQRFGGGGHKTAAGFKSPHSFEKIYQLVLDELKPHFS